MSEPDVSKLILTEDLDNIYRIGAPLWSELGNSRIFLTGGTGFFGCWLLRSLMHAIRHHGINIDVTILSRDPDAFRMVEPELGRCSEFHFLKGGIANFAFPEGDFDYVIHGAADSSNWVLKNDPVRMCKSIINGMQRVLDFACSLWVHGCCFSAPGQAIVGNPPRVVQSLKNGQVMLLICWISTRLIQRLSGPVRCCALYIVTKKILTSLLRVVFPLSAQACPWTRITRSEISSAMCWLEEKSLSEGVV